jgi:hypothetical protein
MMRSRLSLQTVAVESFITPFSTPGKFFPDLVRLPSLPGSFNSLRKEATKMSCITLFAPEATMATTQFVHTTPARGENEQRERCLSMSWIVVTDEQGNQQLRIHWSQVPANFEG